ncbi:MAG: response regulator transcription factor [Bacteroidetes bacterium]|nr:MAG: response regulator transcription factor [Bacteroidota bacterium]
MDKKIKIGVVDDHQLVRKGLVGILSLNPNFEVIAEGNCEEDVYRISEEGGIELLFLDFYIPKPITTDLIKSVLSKGIKVIICSANLEEELITGTLSAGVSGYIHKDIDQEELFSAVEIVMDNEVYLSDLITKNLSKQFIYNAKYGNKYDKGKLLNLTDREIEVIKHFSSGLSYKEIANVMNISTRTVESHKTNIMEKLELQNTIDIVKYAIKNKLIEL